MCSSKKSKDSEKEIVSVTKHGQATIPKQFREKLGITTPGKVLFRESKDGKILVEQVRSPSEMRGFAARSEPSTDQPATELLREKREQDRNERDQRFSSEQ